MGTGLNCTKIKLHEVTKLHEETKLHEAKFERRNIIPRRRFCPKGQFCTTYIFAREQKIQKKKNTKTINKKIRK